MLSNHKRGLTRILCLTFWSSCFLSKTNRDLVSTVLLEGIGVEDFKFVWRKVCTLLWFQFTSVDLSSFWSKGVYWGAALVTNFREIVPLTRSKRLPKSLLPGSFFWKWKWKWKWKSLLYELSNAENSASGFDVAPVLQRCRSSVTVSVTDSGMNFAHDKVFSMLFLSQTLLTVMHKSVLTSNTELKYFSHLGTSYTDIYMSSHSHTLSYSALLLSVGQIFINGIEKPLSHPPLFFLFVLKKRKYPCLT